LRSSRGLPVAMVLPSSARHYTTAVKNAVHRTHTFAFVAGFAGSHGAALLCQALHHGGQERRSPDAH
jgi:hypothetical protein